VHYDLVERLIFDLGVIDARGRQGVGYCLSILLLNLPTDLQYVAQITFLGSRFVGLRRRGYKLIAANPAPPMNLLLEAWTKFYDAECAWLLVKILPPADLVAMKNELLSCLSEGWQISRLYLRIAEVEPLAVEDLRGTDGITYSYVLAKLGLSISAEQAKEFIMTHETDERFGLLVWSIGKMQLWDVLVWLKSRLSEIHQNRHDELVARFDV
jgi:hypothetical protein